MPTCDDQPKGSAHAEEMVRLAQLWSAASPSLEAFVRSLIRDTHDIDDVIQQTGEYVARHFNKYEEGTSFTGWVITVARIRILRLWQGKDRSKLVFNSDAIESIAKAAEEIDGELPERQSALQLCIKKLQPNHRSLIEMCYLGNKKPAQIAEQLGRTANSVSASLMRIRKALRQCIEDRLLQRGGGSS